MIKYLNIEDFLQALTAENSLLLDVRAPHEFRKGHIPGARNIPIFDDEERKTVGILYKQKGRDEAILKGLNLVGPKMAGFVENIKKIKPKKKLLVHCWRGGMRSESMAWLWNMAGFEVEVLAGGYKAYRQKLLQDLGRPLRLIILGGKTGSGKTAILHALAEKGEQILDLEALAHHKGSAFGSLGQGEQPQVEQFENDLYETIGRLDTERPVWVEDESNAIGRVYIPQPFWQQMKQAPVIYVDIPVEVRVERLVREYASFRFDELKESLDKIKKRIGGKNYKLAVDALRNNDYETTAKIALFYYDKAYTYGLNQKDASQLHSLAITLDEPDKTAQQLIDYSQSNQLTQ